MALMYLTKLYHSEVTWASRCLKSAAIQLFVQDLVWANINIQFSDLLEHCLYVSYDIPTA